MSCWTEKAHLQDSKKLVQYFVGFFALLSVLWQLQRTLSWTENWWFYSQVAIILPKPQMALIQLINMSCLPVSLFHPVLPFLLSLKSFSAQHSYAQFLPAHYGSFTPHECCKSIFAVSVCMQLRTCAFSFCANSLDTEDLKLNHSRLWIKVDLGHWVAVTGYMIFRSPPQFPDVLCLMKGSN